MRMALLWFHTHPPNAPLARSLLLLLLLPLHSVQLSSSFRALVSSIPRPWQHNPSCGNPNSSDPAISRFWWRYVCSYQFWVVPKSCSQAWTYGFSGIAMSSFWLYAVVGYMLRPFKLFRWRASNFPVMFLSFLSVLPSVKFETVFSRCSSGSKCRLCFLGFSFFWHPWGCFELGCGANHSSCCVIRLVSIFKLENVALFGACEKVSESVASSVRDTCLILSKLYESE